MARVFRRSLAVTVHLIVRIVHCFVVKHCLVVRVSVDSIAAVAVPLPRILASEPSLDAVAVLQDPLILGTLGFGTLLRRGWIFDALAGEHIS